jgi:hypothetical protein
VNPVVDVALQREGVLTFANAAVAARVADPAASYTLQWFRFDNATDSRRDVDAPQTVGSASAQAPAAILQGTTPGEYIGVTITAQHAAHPAWARPASFFFRRTADGWQWVGAERE